ncbi:MAG: hypothetical protein M3169_01740 [Candidatus Eremiobacteraeota bacterium]|nr:hypothetical protein [Candidatus Eremiobacteraeota bacterium]
MRLLVAALAAIALTAAAPSPAPSPAPNASSAARTVSVVCERTPLYVFVSGTDRPIRAHTPDVHLGERFGLVSGPRTTLESVQFYETDVAVVEPGYARNAHYWISRDCAIPGK